MTGHGALDRLRNAIEATRLGFGLTAPDVDELTRAAVSLGVRAVCVPLQFVPAVRHRLGRAAGAAPNEISARGLQIATVANFPIGDHPLDLVCLQVEGAARAGADHIDLVIPGGLVTQRDWAGVTGFLREARLRAEGAAKGEIPIKVILETAALDEDRIHGAANAAIEAGARWLKTSTGFHPAGGATIAIVSLLRSLAPAGVGVKASGGIRTRQSALALLEAGADRIGTSAERTILG